MFGRIFASSLEILIDARLRRSEMCQRSSGFIIHIDALPLNRISDQEVILLPAVRSVHSCGLVEVVQLSAGDAYQ